MPYKSRSARNKYLRKRYAARADVREGEKVRLQKWRESNRDKLSAQNARQHEKHRERDLKRNRTWYERNRAAVRKRRGLPDPTRPEPKRCELCNATPGKRLRALALDHCHETRRFRGWLCNKCNAGIGALGDNIRGLLRALAYLLRSEETL